MKRVAEGVTGAFLSVVALVWTVISCTVGLVVVAFGRQWSSWVLTRIGGDLWSANLLRWVTRGLDVVPPPDGIWPQRAIYVANHSSQLDINAIFASIPHPVIFLSKASIKRVPFLGWVNSRVGTVFVERGKVDSAIRAAADLTRALERGKAVFVFPEGTRSATGELLPFKKGAFRLAIDAGVPVVPLWIDGTHAALPKGSFLIRRQRIRVRFGAPIAPDGFIQAKNLEPFADEVRSAMLRLRPGSN